MFFVDSLKKQLSCWWFETLWRWCDVSVMLWWWYVSGIGWYLFQLIKWQDWFTLITPNTKLSGDILVWSVLLVIEIFITGVFYQILVFCCGSKVNLYKLKRWCEFIGSEFRTLQAFSVIDSFHCKQSQQAGNLPQTVHELRTKMFEKFTLL